MKNRGLEIRGSSLWEKGPDTKTKGILLSFILILLMTGIISFSDSVEALTLPGGKVNEGSAGGRQFEQNRGIYSDWENPKKGFFIPDEYGFRLSNTKETTFKKLGTEDREGGIAKQEKLFPRGNLSNFWIFNAEENVSGQTGFEAANFEIYNPDTGSKDLVDLRVTFSDWERHTGKAGKEEAFLTITHSSARPVIILMNLKSAKLKMETFKSGTLIPYKMKSNFTIEDIDYHQYIAYSLTKNKIFHQYVAGNSGLLYGVSDGLQVFYGATDVDMPSRIPDYAAGATYETDAFELILGCRDEERVGTYSRFGFASYDMASKETPQPYKFITDPDQKEVKNNRLAHANEQFSYSVTQRIPSGTAPAGYYDSFKLEDEIDSCIKILSAKVQNEAGLDRSSWFDLKVKGQDVIATAKPSVLKNADFYGGVTANDTGYTLVIDCVPDQSKTVECLEEHGHYNEDKTQLSFKNRGTVSVDGREKSTDEVKTQMGVPDLEITESVPRYEWQVTDVIPYTITVKHTEKSTAPATNLMIQDVELPKGLELVENSLKVTGIHGRYSLEKVSGSFRLDAEKLERNETVTITFDTEAETSTNGKIVPDIANVRAYAMTQQKQAEKSVYINSPKLKLEKKTMKEIYHAGDTVSFEMKLTQENPGTFMRDVVITEALKTKGLSLRKGSVQILDSKNRVITPKCEIRMEDHQFSVDTGLHLADRSGSIPPKHPPYVQLPLETQLTVTYEAEVTAGNLAGSEIESVTDAPTRPNTNGDLIYENEEIPSGGDLSAAKIAIKPAVLNMEKTVNDNCFQAGEKGTYQLNISQNVQDALARNIIVLDRFEEWTGMNIQRDSFRVTKEKEDITENCTIEVSERGDSFVLETHTDLAAHEKLMVTYDVVYQDAVLAGKRLVNEAVVRGDHAKEDCDDVWVDIKAAKLEVEKRTDRSVYRLGERINYQLSVRQMVSHAAADNIKIRDFLEKKGAELISDSITVKEAGRDITGNCTVTIDEDRQGFIVSTGKALKTEDRLQIFYEVLLHDSFAANQNLKNTAIVSGDNVSEVKTENEVAVKDRGVMQIEKNSERCLYAPGEKVQYQLKITGTSRVPARKIRIKDQMEMKSAVLDSKSIEIIDSHENILTKNCKIKAQENGFDIQTPIQLEKNQEIRVLYEIQLPDKMKTGTEVRNTASVKGDNTEEKKTDTVITVMEPEEVQKFYKNSDSFYRPDGLEPPYTADNNTPASTVQTGDSFHTKFFLTAAVLALLTIFILFHPGKKQAGVQAKRKMKKIR